MNAHTLKILEFERVKEELRKLAYSQGGRELVNSLFPSVNTNEIVAWQKDTTEARNFLAEVGVIPLSDIISIDEIISNCVKGVTITSEHAQDVLKTIKTAKEIKRHLEDNQTMAPNLWGIAKLMQSQNNLERIITKAIDENGEIRDDASERLHSIRNQSKIVKSRVKAKLDEIIKTSSYSKMIQDPVITIRDDRYVIPLKAEFKNHFPCIVQDSSSSGQTLYVEPLSVLPLNNDIRNLRQRSREEIERILTEITKEIAYVAADLEVISDSLSHIDFIFAKAYLSEKWRCIEPEMVEKPKLNIIGARHPLLTVEPVPIDLRVGDDFGILVLTGPNTGGKTVSLKTAGLFVAMAQSGLHIPASLGTVIGRFDDVFADIGDEQSVSQNLSTFSSHMSNTISILLKASKNSLVLLDELGAGTDPTEGAVLAYSIVSHLYDNEVPTLVTTHIGELKAFAYKHPKAKNASVGFDPDTLNPTYKILIGTPGASHAFDICKKLGLPESIIEKANNLLTSDQKDTNQILSQMSIDAKKIEEERIAATQTRDEIESIKYRHKKELEFLEENKSSLIDKELGKAKRFLSSKIAEADEIVRKLAQATRQSKETDRLHKRLDAIRDEIESPSEIKIVKGEPPEMETLRPGETVYVPRFKSQGMVLEKYPEKGKVLVQVGTARVQVPISQLEIAEDSDMETAVIHTKTSFEKVPIKLELFGLPIDEALLRLERYLDSAYGAGLPFVYIVHGRGTGALRKSITDFLPNSPRVDRFHLADEADGGDAVTIVFLK
ncbi:MAG TPA: endonuclease MutS2 [Caldisericia bacterium]|nr:endonuclease MutS2 [Caldisericia bacterium]HPF49025.1 endonuclease MutS2 [Caldisericia bacterium]HPI83111.1 endonuclease MutS2 [Caldisericia bacterium]HPQ92338.1 endonuclease MutS2 [Caldisericia bacterium]HRV74564.1 endonuclease MutS2 [Caldisericia bacterium]